MTQWWQQAVVYQIYPRSFQDSNGDGIGDLPGIISRLDYLQDLGVDALWLSPVYRSPGVDNGYDISDYEAIDPQFGTMADMRRLIQAAKARHIKIVMDLVVNHTSDQHPWFQAAARSRADPHRDWYIWRDPVDGHEPNDLRSTFSGSAWAWSAATGQYYLHLFGRQQPDLNWANPVLRQAIYRMMNFWLDEGIGGFRLDVIDLIGKDPDAGITANGPHLHDYLREMNAATFGRFPVMTVGETWGATPAIAQQFSDPAHHELSMVFQFEAMQLDQVPGQSKWVTRPLDHQALRDVLCKWQTELDYHHGWNALFWNNHDLPRIVSRWGDDGRYRVRSAKMLAILLHLLRGTPYIYQGEELGMTNAPIERIEQVQDIESRNAYAEQVAAGVAPATMLAAINRMGRDNARTPMQWTAGPQAGFTAGTPWLPVNANHRQINAAAAQADQDSVLATYRQLVALRHTHPLVVWGEFAPLTTVPGVMAYTRTYQGETWLIVANLTGTAQSFTSPAHLDAVIISNMTAPTTLSSLQLAPYQAFVAKVTGERDLNTHRRES
ncbi:glycoside hydrolase family 13 protein [Lacticaseibacillus absianus]|uniref:glycoside hydrolase family 13 protein n=1 Tax=Lacticaseibacillus absianus TaxID=2729623 RepID=UPI0015C9A79F|nr:alpha-glucosidase [Lacticaseibacillus absianus]